MSRHAEQNRTRDDHHAVQLTLYVAEPHIGDRRSQVDQLMRAAAQAGVPGGTVLAAHEGFGRRHVHEPTFWHRADETPLTVVFVDTADGIARVLALVDEILPDAVAFSEPVRAIRYARHPGEPRPGQP